MKKADCPVMIVYPPENLSDEAAYAVTEILCEICRAFEQHYSRQITRHINLLEQDTRFRVCTVHPREETRDEKEPF